MGQLIGFLFGLGGGPSRGRRNRGKVRRMKRGDGRRSDEEVKKISNDDGV